MKHDLETVVNKTAWGCVLLVLGILGITNESVAGSPIFDKGMIANEPGAVTMASDRSDRSLDELVRPETSWSGRMLWEAVPGDSERDWYLNFHITARDGSNFRGRLDMGSDGHAAAKSLVFEGDFRDNQIEFTTTKAGNFQVQFGGELVNGKTLELRWEGHDRHNRTRTGTAKINLRKVGTATDGSN